MTGKTIIEIQIWPDLDPGKFMWYDETTYETMNLRSYGFNTPEEAFEDAKVTVSKHYSRPDLLEFKMTMRTVN